MSNSEHDIDELILVLKRAGFVDPADDTVAMFTSATEPIIVWTTARTLAETILNNGYRKREAHDGEGG